MTFCSCGSPAAGYAAWMVLICWVPCKVDVSNHVWLHRDLRGTRYAFLRPDDSFGNINSCHTLQPVDFIATFPMSGSRLSRARQTQHTTAYKLQSLFSYMKWHSRVLLILHILSIHSALFTCTDSLQHTATFPTKHNCL